MEKNQPGLEINKSEFKQFSVDALQLGKLVMECESLTAIASVFDLEGFTTFCGESEFERIVPKFLNEFLTWFIDTLKKLTFLCEGENDDKIFIRCPLPFKIKFMGDGLLVLWNVDKLSSSVKSYIVYLSYLLCDRYERDFRKRESLQGWSRVPNLMRCGVAEGKVYSVGDKKDFVGPCINIAARLEKAPGSTFAYDMKLIDESVMGIPFFKDEFHRMEMAIRGIGDSEKVAILRSEYEVMTIEEKDNYEFIERPKLFKRN